MPRKGRPYAERSTYSRCLAVTRLTRRCTQTSPKDDAYEKVFRPYSREAAGLLDATSPDGAYDKWMHRFEQRDIGLRIDEHLGLEVETYL
jgi:hypothetical protein